MDSVTTRVRDYINSRGISIKKISEALNLPYGAMFDSLSPKSASRKLRADEFLMICAFLNIDPWFFADKDTTNESN